MRKKCYGSITERYEMLRSVTEELRIITECYRALRDVTEHTEVLWKRYGVLRSITEHYGALRYCPTPSTITTSIEYTHPSTDPTHHPKQHPDPISCFATLHFPDRHTDRQMG